jgi:uncharacterized membrane protein
MSKEWTGSVRINAPVEAVYAYLADFARLPEWDAATMRVERKKAGDASGVGAAYRVYEHLKLPGKDKAGLAEREVRELVPNRRIAWHAHPVPRMGVSLDCAFEFERDGDGTRLTETVQVNMPAIVDKMQHAVFRSLDDQQRAQWQENLARIKANVEQGAPAAAPELALAGR